VKLTTYKDIDIIIDESGKFKADIEKSDYKDTFQEVKAFIDKYTQVKPLNIPIIKIPYVYREPYCIVSGKITKPDGDKAWYVMENGDRGKDDDFIADTPENRRIAQQVCDIKNKIAELSLQADSLEKTLKTV